MKQGMQTYFKELSEYNSYSLLKRIFKFKPEKPEFDQIGNLYTIRYGDLTTSILDLKDVGPRGNQKDYWYAYNYGSIVELNSDSEIDDLYAKLEYQGDGVYKDLITGMSFIISERVLSKGISNTFTDSEESLHERLMRFPLGFPIFGEVLTPDGVTDKITYFSASRLFVEQKTLNPSINRIIEKYDEEMINSIKAYLKKKEEIALDAIKGFFDGKQIVSEASDEPASPDEALTLEELKQLKEEFTISDDKPKSKTR